jgi:RNA polymerase sigma factor (sigma-70 family)
MVTNETPVTGQFRAHDAEGASVGAVEPGEVYDVFFRRVMPRALGAAVRLLGDRTLAEDVAVEALGRAYARWDTISTLTYRDAWALRVVSNISYDELRRQRRLRGALDAAAFPQPSSDPVETATLRLTFVPALRKLSRRQRETIILIYIAGLSRETVAELLGCSAESIKTYRRRGLARLRSDLGAMTMLDVEDDGD